MPSNANVYGQRIAYENTEHDTLSEKEASLYDTASFEVETALEVIDEIQEERTNEDGEITDLLTLRQVRTILEVGIPLERSLTVLEAPQDSSEEVL